MSLAIPLVVAGLVVAAASETIVRTDPHVAKMEKAAMDLTQRLSEADFPHLVDFRYDAETDRIRVTAKLDAVLPMKRIRLFGSELMEELQAALPTETWSSQLGVSFDYLIVDRNRTPVAS